MNLKLSPAPRAWYREPWPWLLMLGPAIVIVAGLTTAYLAIVTSDGLVDDDYYKQGLTVNERAVHDRRAADLGLETELVLGGDGDRIRALLRGKEGLRLPETLRLNLVHPTRPGFDQKIILHSEGGGVYAGVVKPFVGRWHVTLEDERQDWRLVGDWRVTDRQSTLRLAASGVASSTGISDNSGR